MSFAEIDVRLNRLERQWWMIGYALIGALLLLSAAAVLLAQADSSAQEPVSPAPLVARGPL